MLVALLGVGVFAAYVNLTPGAARVGEDLRAKPPVERQDPEVSVQGNRVAPSRSVPSGELLVPTVVGEEVKLGPKLGSMAPGVDPKEFLLSETLAALGIDGGRVVGVEVKDGVAYVDVNDAVVSHGYGSMEEAQLVKGFQMALGQFPEVRSFQFRNGGEIVDSLGHLEMTTPVTVVRSGG